VALVRTDVSEERIAFIIRMKRINELGIMLAAASDLLATQRHTQDDDILHSSRSDYLKSDIILILVRTFPSGILNRVLGRVAIDFKVNNTPPVSEQN
jgi:hypothetical protein